MLSLELQPTFRCDFRDPRGNRIQVVDLHDESLIWLLPYREVQKAGAKFGQWRRGDETSGTASRSRLTKKLVTRNNIHHTI
jgi:hypothetical protein